MILIHFDTKYRKGKWKLLPNIEEVTVGHAHTNTQKLNRNILTGMSVFLIQKRASVCVYKSDWLNHFNRFHVIHFHRYLKSLYHKGEEIYEDPWTEWWTVEMRPEWAKSGPFLWKLHDVFTLFFPHQLFMIDCEFSNVRNSWWCDEW